MSDSERQRLATKAGLSLSQATTYTGADLAFRSLIVTSGQTGSKDAPTLIKSGGSA